MFGVLLSQIDCVVISVSEETQPNHTVFFKVVNTGVHQTYIISLLCSCVGRKYRVQLPYHKAKESRTLQSMYLKAVARGRNYPIFYPDFQFSGYKKAPQKLEHGRENFVNFFSCSHVFLDVGNLGGGPFDRVAPEELVQGLNINFFSFFSS